MLASAWTWTIRIGGLLLCGGLLFQSWRIAEAETLALSGKPGDLDKAIAIEPHNVPYRILKASDDLFDNAVSPARTETELREVLRESPRNAEALMDLGVLAEGRGDLAGAEQFFKQAAAADLTFKPSWTLVNFYFRTNQTAKMWPVIRRALDVTTKPDLSYFDVQTVYDLCWQSGADPKQILSVIPPHPQAWLEYYVYLIAHRHLEAAYEVYPKALAAADPSSDFHRAVFADLSLLLYEAHRVSDAVAVWNELVRRKMLVSTELHPEAGVSIANADFEFPLERSPFGWWSPKTAEIGMSYAPHAVLFELSGNQPESAVLLLKNAPIVAGKDYFLTWKVDGTGITRPTDPREIGLLIRLSADGKPVAAACQPFLGPEKDRGCTFHAPENAQAVTIQLVAERLPGTVRTRGALQVNEFRLSIRTDAMRSAE